MHNEKKTIHGTEKKQRRKAKIARQRHRERNTGLETRHYLREESNKT